MSVPLCSTCRMKSIHGHIFSHVINVFWSFLRFFQCKFIEIVSFTIILQFYITNIKQILFFLNFCKKIVVVKKSLLADMKELCHLEYLLTKFRFSIISNFLHTQHIYQKKKNEESGYIQEGERERTKEMSTGFFPLE